MQTRNLLIVLATLGLASAASADPLGFTYTYDGTGTTPNGTYPDTGGIELNNNLIGTSAYTDTNWVGFGSPPSQVRLNIDFGGEFDFTSLAISYLVDTSVAQSHAPASFDVSVDGGSFVNFTGFNSAAGVQSRSTSFDLTGFSGELMVLRFNPAAQPWMFLSELDFEGTEVVPEPSSAVLALGGLMLLARRRR